MNQRAGQRSGQRSGTRLTAPAAATGTASAVGRRRLVGYLQGVSHHQISLLLKKLFAIPLLFRDLALLRQIFLASGEIYHLGGLVVLRCFVQLIRLSPRSDTRQHRLTNLLFEVVVRLLLIVQLLLGQVLLVMGLRRHDATLQHRMAQRQRRRLSPTCGKGTERDQGTRESDATLEIFRRRAAIPPRDLTGANENRSRVPVVRRRPLRFRADLSGKSDATGDRRARENRGQCANDDGTRAVKIGC